LLCRGEKSARETAEVRVVRVRRAKRDVGEGIVHIVDIAVVTTRCASQHVREEL
jgi:hypothetical protein